MTHEARGVAGNLDDWRTLISGATPPFKRVETVADSDFHGRIHCALRSGILTQFVDVEAERHLTRRTEQHIQSTPEPMYAVHLQLEGISEIRQAGQIAELRPGHYALVTSTEPFTWEFDGGFSLLSIRFPQSACDLPFRAMRGVIGHSFSGRDPLGRHIVPLIESISRDPGVFDGAAGGRMARTIVELFESSFFAFLDERQPRNEREQMRELTDYIARHLGDQSLTPSSVAAAHYMSTRSLQLLFQRNGTTVSGWIRERRLERARQQIEDVLLADLTIGSIAAKCGFSDQAYFSRLFKDAFGMSPREARDGALAAL